MSTVRKRKMMIRRLDHYFKDAGGIMSEREYSQTAGVPYRKEMIKKYLGGWPRMIAYLGYYYPYWKETDVVVEEEPVAEAPKIDLSALEQDDDE